MPKTPEQAVPGIPQPERERNFLAAFWPFFRPYRRKIATWFLIYGIYFLGGILTPIAVKFYFDSFLPSRQMHRIWVFAGMYLIYATALHVVYFFGVRGTVRIIESVVADLRLAVYEKLHRLTIRFFDKTLSGEIVNRVTNDTRQLLNLVGGELVNVSLQICLGVVSLVILIVWNTRLAVVVLVFLPVYVWVFRRFRPEVRKAARQWRKGEDHLWGNWGEKLKGMALIQAFVREKSEGLKHHQYGHSALDRWYRMAMLGTQMGILSGVTSGISNHFAYSLGCLLVVEGKLNLGELLSLSAMIGYIIGPVQGVFNLVGTWQQSAVSSDRILRILEEMEEVRQTEGRLKRVGKFRGEVRFDHVNFEYEKDTPVLNDISCFIGAGRKAALVGHTGSGKSTMIHLLLGFYRPQGGTILIDGVPTTEIDPRDLRRNIGIVPQDVVLFRDSVRANVAYGRPDAPEEDIWRVLAAAQIDDYVKGLPKGLDTRLGGDDGVNPSEGEAQRLSVARALLTDPSIVILDEATASLDSEEEGRLQRAIGELLKGRTAIIIAHRLSTLTQCDLVVVLERGRLLEEGNPAELLNKRDGAYAGLYRAYYASGAIRRG